MTVEASLIIPFVIVLFVLIIYLLFFQYDRCLLTQDSYLTAFSESVVKSKEIRGYHLNNAKYFMLGTIGSRTEEEGPMVVVTANAAVVPEVFAEHELLQGLWQIGSRAQARRMDPPADVRRFRRIRYLLKKGYQILKDTNQ